MTKNGGPAFPTTLDADDGMSLRDYLAAHAPKAPKWWLAIPSGRGDVELSLEDCARQVADWAYLYADVMLRTRDL